jgi:hypothetical protein
VCLPKVIKSFQNYRGVATTFIQPLYNCCLHGTWSSSRSVHGQYVTEKHEYHVLCKPQQVLTAVNLWCECWSIKITEEKTPAIYFSRRLRVPDNVLQLKGWDIPFVNNVMYLGVTFDRMMIWRHQTERTTAKALYTYVKTYSLFKIGHLSTNIKLALYKALIRSVMTHACPT